MYSKLSCAACKSWEADRTSFRSKKTIAATKRKSDFVS